MTAERAAHHHNLSSPVDDEKSDAVPDIFSIVAQESLLDTLQPAFKHLVKVITASYPAQLGWLYRNTDELYLLLNVVVEYASLHKFNGSFSERFYGLKRLTLDGRPLSSRHKVISLLLLVGIPYIQHKLQDFYDVKSVEVADGKLQGRDMMSRIQRAVVSMYPYLYMAWSSLSFSYFVRFLLHRSDVHSLALRLARIKLAPVDLSDMIEEPSSPWSRVFLQSTVGGKLKFLLAKMASSLPDIAFQTFSSAVFFLQFLQWYSNYSQAEGQRETITTASAIPAPKLPESSHSNKLLCPVCMKTRTNSTALSTSGYVFCYPCIYKYVQRHGKCPVTSFPAKLDNLIKIYMPET